MKLKVSLWPQSGGILAASLRLGLDIVLDSFVLLPTKAVFEEVFQTFLNGNSKKELQYVLTGHFFFKGPAPTHTSPTPKVRGQYMSQRLLRLNDLIVAILAQVQYPLLVPLF